MAAELQLPADTRGLIVTDVTPGGPAWEVLFDDPQRGGPDIILSVEGKPVRTEADLRKALQAEKPGSIVSIRVYNPAPRAGGSSGSTWRTRSRAVGSGQWAVGSGQ